MSERLQEVDKAPTMKICASTNDTRRLDFFVEGLSLSCRVQLALDVTLVSAHHEDGTDEKDGVALKLARIGEDSYSELCDANGRARLVVDAFSRISGPRQCAVRSEDSPSERAGAEDCWRALPFATSLLEKRSDPGGWKGRLPRVHKVLGDASEL